MKILGFYGLFHSIFITWGDDEVEPISGDGGPQDHDAVGEDEGKHEEELAKQFVVIRLDVVLHHLRYTENIKFMANILYRFGSRLAFEMKANYGVRQHA